VPRLRSSEWFLLIYFAYVACVSPFFVSAWRPCLVAIVVAALVLRLAGGESWLRDLLPLPLTLAAFWEMDWFTPLVRNPHWEQTLIVWDRTLFDRYGLSAAVESAGHLMPMFLELCYMLVYLVAPVALWALIANRHRDPARPAPHNLYAHVGRLLDQAGAASMLHDSCSPLFGD